MEKKRALLEMQKENNKLGYCFEKTFNSNEYSKRKVNLINRRKKIKRATGSYLQ